jgi:hypothetical protein
MPYLNPDGGLRENPRAPVSEAAQPWAPDPDDDVPELARAIANVPESI